MRKYGSPKLEIFGFSILRRRHRTYTCGSKEPST